MHSALAAVGLTAVVSAALAQAGISCNVIAGYHHDHLLVPLDSVEEALTILRDVAAGRGPSRAVSRSTYGISAVIQLSHWVHIRSARRS